MLTIGFILLLCPIHLVKTQVNFQSYKGLVFQKEGDTVIISCVYQSKMAMHFSWYKHQFGQKPKLISNFYKYDKEATFHQEFKDNARFSMVNEKGVTYLEIKELQLSDSATYYCGSAHSNIVEFGEGTELVVQVSQLHGFSVLQQPVLNLVHPGDSVSLHCMVITDNCAEEQSVYWFRLSTGHSHPGVIYTYEDNSGWCKKNPKTGSLTQTCVYSLPKNNISPADAGTYYCAISACGLILFGNGTKLGMDVTGLGHSEHIYTLVLLSIFRTFVLFCCVIALVLHVCKSRMAKNSYRKTTKKKSKLPS